MNQDKLISISQASKLLGVNTMTLRRWTNSGKIKCWNDSFYFGECKTEEPIYLDSRALI